MKKRIILTTLILLTSLTCKVWSSNNRAPSLEKEYWNFIKERLFDGENNIASKFQKNIYIHLVTKDAVDSVIVSSLLEELRTLIPNKKIGYCNSLTRRTSINVSEEVIVIGVNEFKIQSNGYLKKSKEIDGNQIFYDGFKGLSQPDIFMQTAFILLNDSISYSERKRYIEYAIVRSLCTIKGKPQEASTFFEKAIFNGFDYEPYGTEFSEADKFLLQKLYSNDFNNQFKNYLIEAHSPRYYRAFLFKKQFQSIKILLAILITLLVLSLSYKTILFRNYKRKIVGYIVSAVLIASSIILLNFVLINISSLYIYPSGGDIITLFLILLVSAAIGCILYLLEYLFIKPNYTFNKRILLNIILVFVTFCIPIIVYIVIYRKNHIHDAINYVTIILVFAIGRGFLLYIKEIGDSTIRKKDFELIKLKELNTKAEMKSLNAKINPHFLYNSLNSIAGLSRSNPNKAEQMAIALSDFYRYITNRSTEQVSTVFKEVEMVKSYLEIEKIRFGTRLNFDIQVDSKAEQFSIPRNILQPIVENAIKHGISKIEEQGEINLIIKKSDNGIIINVYDNGPAFSEGLVSGFGLQSIQDILKLYYNENAALSWQNNPIKMVVVEINVLS